MSEDSNCKKVLTWQSLCAYTCYSYEALTCSWRKAFKMQYRFAICERVLHFPDESHFSWQSYCTGLLYVRVSYIFLTKGISPDRTTVQVYCMWDGLTFSWRKAFFLTELQYRFTILCERVSHFPDEGHFSWQSCSTGLLYVRRSHIFSTNCIFPERATVHVYYMWEGLTFSWQKAFLLTELQYRFTICERVSHFPDERHFSTRVGVERLGARLRRHTLSKQPQTIIIWCNSTPNGWHNNDVTGLVF